MLSEEVIDKVIERLVNRIEQANEYVLKEIGGHIKRVRNVIPSRAYQLGQLIKYGGDYDKIVKKLAEITNLNVKEIYEIFEEVAKNDYYFAKQFYRYKSKKYIPYEYNTELQNQVKAIARLTANEYVNLSNTFGFAMRENGKLVYTDLSQTYQDAIDKAVLSVSQGTTTFDEQMRETIRELGESGIRTIDYASGRSKRLDSAVRMNLKEGLRTLHNETQKMFGEQFGSDGVEISVHAYPAPDHEDVQGRQFSNEEFDKFQNHIDAVDYKGNLHTADFNGYDRRAISTLNCYHTTFSIVLGVSKPEYTDKQLQEIKNKNEQGFEFEGKHYTLYEGSQLQRKIELEVRKQKDIQIIAKESGNNELVYQSQEKIRQFKNKYTELNNVSGLKPKYERMRINNYKMDKTAIQKHNEEIDKMKVGTFDISNFDTNIETTTNDVILTPRQRQHIENDHPDVVKYFDNIQDVLSMPDRVFKEQNKEDTLWLLKTINEDKLRLTLKLNTINNVKEKGYKNSIIQYQIMKHSSIDNLLEKGRIEEIFKK